MTGINSFCSVSHKQGWGVGVDGVGCFSQSRELESIKIYRLGLQTDSYNRFLKSLTAPRVR